MELDIYAHLHFLFGHNVCNDACSNLVYVWINASDKSANTVGSATNSALVSCNLDRWYTNFYGGIDFLNIGTGSVFGSCYIISNKYYWTASVTLFDNPTRRYQGINGVYSVTPAV